jgi:RNA 2',3'-cyclic 3'-phosphodiesterase
MASKILPQNNDAAAGAASKPAARVFVAVKAAPDIADELTQMAADLARFGVHRVAPADIHLTLMPPWNETSISAAIAKLRGVADKAHPFTLVFQRFGYGPQPRRPHLLWADCAASDELAALHAALLVAFGQSDERPFRPHVTVARIRGNGAAIARKQPIERALTFSQRVETVELMQSPQPGEAGYRVLASLKLGKPEPSVTAG